MHATSPEDFAELRSLMNTPHHTLETRLALWATMQRVARADEPRYRSEWIPYMMGFPQHFIAPLDRLYSLDALERAAQLAPHARFELELRELGNTRHETLRELNDHPGLARLTALDLSQNQLDDELIALLDSPHLGTLHTLILGDNALSDATLCAMAEHPRLAHLTTLLLWDNCFGPRGVRALLSSPHLIRLERLDLSQNTLGTPDFEAMLQAMTLPELRILDLTHTRLTDAHLEQLARAEALSTLHTLRLHDEQLSEQGRSVVMSSPHLAELRELSFTA